MVRLAEVKGKITRVDGRHFGKNPYKTHLNYAVEI